MKRILSIVTMCLLLTACAGAKVNHHQTTINTPIKIHYVDSASEIPCEGVWYGCVRRMVGNTKPNVVLWYEIWVVAKRNSAGEIVVGDYLMGHELRHVLNWIDSDVADPDEDWEYRLIRRKCE